MTEESETDPKSGAREPKLEQRKTPWKTPRLVVQGTITLRTLGKSGPDTPSG